LLVGKTLCGSVEKNCIVLYNNKVFSNKQFEFIKVRSTVTQLLKVMDIWIEALESDV